MVKTVSHTVLVLTINTVDSSNKRGASRSDLLFIMWSSAMSVKLQFSVKVSNSRLHLFLTHTILWSNS